jgi:lipoic acid synthetase
MRSLRVRWLGRVGYEEALDLQHSLHKSNGQYLLMLEHPHVYTLGVRAKMEHLLVDPLKVGATVVPTDRGGDITYHGPGQLVAYPIIDVPIGPDATPRYVHLLEQVLIDVLGTYGIDAYTMERYPGVWVDHDSPRKIAAIGVRITRERSLHGIALNVNTDMSMFDHIVPCGIREFGVTSMQGEGVATQLIEVAERFKDAFATRFGFDDLSYHGLDRAKEHHEPGGSLASALEVRLDRAGFPLSSAVDYRARKPDWIRPKVRLGEEFLVTSSLIKRFSLVTVCEEAGCPNRYECWRDGTATFMINGERCTRACAFCLVDTAKPFPLDETEPDRVAGAVKEMGLDYAVVTAVARDDLEDGGAAAFAATIAAIRERNPGCKVEVLIPDFKGSRDALKAVIAESPDVLNHNVETVLRLQRAVRPSASYARSLAVLARAKDAGLTTKSGLIVGLGETLDEVEATMEDLRAVGTDILTVGQYLRPSPRHMPVARYLEPAEFDAIRELGYRIGFSFVEASPLARSSYHAKRGATQTLGVANG